MTARTSESKHEKKKQESLVENLIQSKNEINTTVDVSVRNQ